MIKDEQEIFVKSMLYVFLYNICLKCQKSGRKLEMLCRKAKHAEKKGIEPLFSLSPEDIYATPSGRNPETAPENYDFLSFSMIRLRSSRFYELHFR